MKNKLQCGLICSVLLSGCGGGSGGGSTDPPSTDPPAPTATAPSITTQPANQTVTAGATAANGTSNGLVWAYQHSATAGKLHAYDATNLATELYNTGQATGSRDSFGGGNKFIAPMVTAGKVFLGTSTGVAIFGLLP